MKFFGRTQPFFRLKRNREKYWTTQRNRLESWFEEIDWAIVDSRLDSSSFEKDMVRQCHRSIRSSIRQTINHDA
ncbi:hypothetical protein E3N88_27979 [Mikania micrantha]|uniref:Uncharacterized protein n=1 Tax=Mikania micrantha TaxID=192012 RepID=A0A5N6MYC0_9ASTR|nr:hypothetical protein E3N88_27979 [Mikania micrantha]